jgi:hypothetical protein
MRLVLDEHAGVEVRIAGYQFPGNATADYDSNWLVIEGTVRHPRGAWTFRDPGLLTYEVARLADWLDAVAAGTEATPWCAFIEPNLSFDVSSESADRVLRMSFALEALPPWAETGEEIYIEFPVNRVDFRAAAASLRSQLSSFPQRAER